MEGKENKRQYILDFIRENMERKKKRGLFPTHTTLREIGEEHIEEIRLLEKEGKVKVGDTINDIYIVILE